LAGLLKNAGGLQALRLHFETLSGQCAAPAGRYADKR